MPPLHVLRALRAASLAAVAALAVPAAAHAQRDLDRQVSRLISAAEQRVVRADPSCTPPFARDQPAPAITDAEPSEALRSVLGVFRRPPTPEEIRVAEDEARASMGIGAQEVSRRGARIVALPDGRQAIIATQAKVVFRGLDRATFDRCRAAVRRAAIRLGRDEAPRVRARALGLLDRIARLSRPPVTPPAPTEGLTLTISRPGGAGSTGGPFDRERFVRQGLFLSTGQGLGQNRGRSRLSGVVPDGVATVELTYPRFVSRGPRRARTDYGTAHRVTAQVTDNVLSVQVPRRPEDAFAPRMTWRAADGSVVRVVKPPGR